jgi:Zn-dependent peptidase ImmA (M78 family)
MKQMNDTKARTGYCRDMARKLLRESGMDKPPVAVEQIAENNGFAVKLLDGQAKSFSGILHRQLKAIGINAEHPKVRRRFSIAHELGHYYLDHPQEDEAALDDAAAARWKLCETEANEFAGELLVPRELLKAECDNIKKLPLEEKVTHLTSFFLVSREVMVIQLNKHNLLMKI